MDKISLENIAKYTGGTLIGENLEINSISTNSRDGAMLFVPIIGEKFDGHNFIDDACNNGSIAFISEKSIKTLKPYILVGDTKKALLDIAHGYIKTLSSLKVIAITGSVGKTTTKEMIYSVLSKKYKTLKTQGNLNNEIGLPLTIFNLDKSYQYAVLEMGMSDFGEIELLSLCANPDIAIITNIGVSHIENLGSRLGILKAKLEIKKGLKKDGILLLNAKEPLLAGQKAEYFGEVLNILQKDEKSHVLALCNNEKIEYTLNTVGEHNAMNALCAWHIGVICGIEQDLIKDGLLEFINAKMRQNIYKNGDITIIDDSYNASPDSMKAALSVLAKYENRSIAVLGDMGELGNYSIDGHNEVIKFAQNCADIIILIGNEFKKILPTDKIIFCDTHEQICDCLRQVVKKDDVILFKGSRFMKMEDCIKKYLEGN